MHPGAFSLVSIFGTSLSIVTADHPGVRELWNCFHSICNYRCFPTVTKQERFCCGVVQTLVLASLTASETILCKDWFLLPKLSDVPLFCDDSEVLRSTGFTSKSGWEFMTSRFVAEIASQGHRAFSRREKIMASTFPPPPSTSITWLLKLSYSYRLVLCRRQSQVGKTSLETAVFISYFHMCGGSTVRPKMRGIHVSWST